MKVDLYAAAEWMIVDAAQAYGLTVNNQRLPAIKCVCVELTKCLNEFEVEEYTPSIDPRSHELCLKFKSLDIVTQNGRKHPLFNAISNASHFDFSTDDGENVTMKLWFDNIYQIPEEK